MKQLAEFIKNGDNFAVISHVSPDGDTLGSAAALLYALKKLNKKAQWFCEGNIPHDYTKIPEFNILLNGDRLKKAEYAIAVDVSTIIRTGNCIKLFKRTKHTAVLDHHVTNTGFGEVNVIRDRNATAFLVMELLRELDIPLDYNMARCLLAGVLTDTGRLSHSTVTPQDLRDTAELYAVGINHHEIISALFQTASLKKIKLKGRASEHLETAFDGKVAYTWLDIEDYAEFSADSSDSEGVIELARSVEGALVAFFVRETPDGYKASMRCIPQLDVASICTSFGGGGHKAAAGCTIKGDRETVINTLLNAIKEVL
ncbi:MAG: bifunctional oligoribonuclease/PAP phosphatase NrnA [Clostridia bacterium]|nr:bifunctional oligoribonuclease/PAP phosphatase NrnA [Clostridia bacterium]